MTRDWKQPSASSPNQTSDTQCCDSNITLQDDEDSPLLAPSADKKSSATTSTFSSSFFSKTKPKKTEKPSKSTSIGKMFALTGMAYCLLSMTSLTNGASLPDEALAASSSPVVVISGSSDAQNNVIPSGTEPVVEVVALTTPEPTTSAEDSTTLAVGIEQPTTFNGSVSHDEAIGGPIDDKAPGEANKTEEEEEFLGEYVTEITIRDAACGEDPPEFLVRKGEKKNISFWIPADPVAVEFYRTSTLPTTVLPTTTEPETTTAMNENVADEEENLADDDASQKDNLVETNAPASVTVAESETEPAGTTTVKAEKLATLPVKLQDTNVQPTVLPDEDTPATSAALQDEPDADAIEASQDSTTSTSASTHKEAETDDEIVTTPQPITAPEENPPIIFSATFQDEPDTDDDVGDSQDSTTVIAINQEAEKDKEIVTTLQPTAVSNDTPAIISSATFQNEPEADSSQDLTTTPARNQEAEETVTTPQTIVQEEVQPVTSSATFQDEPEADAIPSSQDRVIDALKNLVNAVAADESPADLVHDDPTTPQPTEAASLPLLAEETQKAVDDESPVQEAGATESQQETTTEPKNPLESQSKPNDPTSTVPAPQETAEVPQADEPAEVEDQDTTTATIKTIPLAEGSEDAREAVEPTEAEAEETTTVTTKDIQIEEEATNSPTSKTERKSENTITTKIKGSFDVKPETTNPSTTTEEPTTAKSGVDVKSETTTEVTATEEAATVKLGKQDTEDEEEGVFMSRLPTRKTVQPDERAEEVPKQPTAKTAGKRNERPTYTGSFSRIPPMLFKNKAEEKEEKKLPTDKPTTTMQPTTTEADKLPAEKTNQEETSAVQKTDPTDEPATTTRPSETAAEKEANLSSDLAVNLPNVPEQEIKRSQPDETPGEDLSIRQEAPKEDEVLAAIYGLLNANGVGEGLGSASVKAVVRKRKANELDLITDATDAPEEVTKPATVVRNQGKPGANYRTVDEVYAAHDRESPIENQVRGPGENDQKHQQGGGSLWNFFRNAYNNAGSLWTSDDKKPKNGKKPQAEISRPDPFQVIPAPQLGNLRPQIVDAEEESKTSRKRIKTEEITDGGITHVIIGSYSLDESEPEQAAETIVGHGVHVNPEISEGQALSVSYKLAVEPGTRVHQIDGVIAGFDEPHLVAGSLYPGSGLAHSAQDRVDSDNPEGGKPKEGAFHNPQITYDWVPSNGPDKTRVFNDEDLFVGTVEDVSLTVDSYPHQSPHKPNHRRPIIHASSEADLPVVSYNKDHKNKPTNGHKQDTRNKHKQQVFLPGDFVKAKFQPEDVSAFLSEDDKHSKPKPVAPVQMKIEALLPPDEKIQIPIALESEGSSSGQEGADEKNGPAPKTEPAQAQTPIVVENMFQVQKVKEPSAARPAEQQPTRMPPQKPTLSPTSSSTSAKPIQKVTTSKPAASPILKKPVKPISEQNKPESPKMQIPAPVLPPTLPAAKAPPGNGIEKVVQGMKNFQYPSVVIISGKSNTRQQLREEEEEIDPVEAVRRKDERFYRFLGTQPFEMQEAFLRGSPVKTGIRVQRDVSPRFNNPELGAGDGVTCDWRIKAEDPSLFLLVTFRNLSAPFSVDCEGAYIEIERENNGYQARWCGTNNKVADAADHVRQNIILTRSEVRLGVYDDEKGGKAVPTGFDAEVEVIDLRDSGNYERFRNSSAYGQLRRLNPRLIKKR